MEAFVVKEVEAVEFHAARYPEGQLLCQHFKCSKKLGRMMEFLRQLQELTGLTVVYCSLFPGLQFFCLLGLLATEVSYVYSHMYYCLLTSLLAKWRFCLAGRCFSHGCLPEYFTEHLSHGLLALSTLQQDKHFNCCETIYMMSSAALYTSNSDRKR